MKLDLSRDYRHDDNNYSSLVSQQGRIVTDADRNEAQYIEQNLRRTLGRDTVGTTGAPRDAAGYRLTVVSAPGGGPDLNIGAGRMYVDGRLARLAQDVLFTTQPHLPGAGLPESDGDYLAYLDVWERALTALEVPELRDAALGGVDTSARIQTIAQIKLLPIPTDDYNAASKPPEWTALTEPLRGRLTARTAATSADIDDVCTIGARGGYSGTENRLYRVEIHTGGPAGTATYKWSRDNGSVVAQWQAQDGDALTISAAGRDNTLGFHAGDWIEIDDQGLELNGRPGTLARLISVNGESLVIDPDTLRHYDGAGGPNAPGGRALDINEFNHGVRRVRRWDMLNSTGAPLVPAGPNETWVSIENGIEVRFDTDAAREYRNGEYWMIPARVVHRSIEWPHDEGTALPATMEGTNAHHYARLAFVRRSGGGYQVLADARRIFPSLTDAHLVYVGGDGQGILPGAQLTQALQARVETAGGEPVPGVSVRLSVISGGGSLEDVHDATNSGTEIVVASGSDGGISAHWTTGDSAEDVNYREDQRVEARLLAESGLPLPALLLFQAHKGSAGAVDYTPPVLTAPNGDDLMLGVATVQDGLDRLADIKVNKAGDTISGSLNIDEDLEVKGNLTVRGDVIARDTDHMPGDVLLGDQDEDTITIHGTLQSEHSSGVLRIEDGVRVRTGDETEAPFQIDAPVAGLGGRPYRLPLTIDNSANGTALTDYQVLVILDTAALVAAGKLRDDAADLIFTDGDGITQIPHWLESGANTSQTRFWVRVPHVPAGATANVYAYYGNPDATSQSSAQQTFVRVVGGLAGAWRFEAGSGGVLSDFSGNNHNGSVAGSITWSADNPFGSSISGSLVFNGTDNHVDLGLTDNIIGTGNDPFTAAAWIHPTKDLSGGDDIFFFRFRQDSEFFLAFDSSTGTIVTSFRGAAQRGVPFDLASLNNTWHHFAVSYNGGDKNVPTSYTIYMDGTALPAGTVDLGPAGGTSNANVLGADDAGDNTNTLSLFEGRMSQVRVYNRSLSAAEVADLSLYYGYVSLSAPGTDRLRNIAANEPGIAASTEQNVPGTEQTIVYVQPGSGNVGVGTVSPGEKLSVEGIIESKSGGFKFPDGTIQTTAGGDGAGGMSGAFDTLPLGTILAWHRDINGNPELPDGWVECNGQLVDDPLSPFHQLPNIVPDLNGARQSWNSKGSFLRGGDTSGLFEDDMMQGHKHNDIGHTHTARGICVTLFTPGCQTLDMGSGTNSYALNTGYANLTDPVDSGWSTPRYGDETRPVNMSVVWIMKIRQNGLGDAQSVFVKSNFQLLDMIPNIANTNQILTETTTFSGVWRNFNATPITVNLPTSGRFYLRANISYFNRTGGAVQIRALIDDSITGSVITYIPWLQLQDGGSGTDTFTTQIVVGLGGEQDVLAAGTHSVQFQIEMQDSGSLEFDRTGSGHGMHNVEVFGYDLSSQSAGLWEASGADVSRSSGNVGIGTDLPQAKLHIAGEIGVDGILFPDGTLQTTAGQDGGGGNLPLGTVLAWHKSFNNTPALPDGWVECNGQTLSDPASPYDGQIIPDLNNPKETWNTKGAFLRGDTTSGAFEDDRLQGHHHALNDRAFIVGSSGETPGGNNNKQLTPEAETLGAVDDGIHGSPRLGPETRPVNMSVVWIMKVRENALAPPAGGYALLSERQSSGTNGGLAPVTSSWFTRTLNDLETNIAGISLNSNEFTLPEGSYLIRAHAPGHRVLNFRIRLFNITDGTPSIPGRAAFAANGPDSEEIGEAHWAGFTTLDSPKSFRLEMYALFQGTSDAALGYSTNTGDDEVYTQIEIIQLAQPTPEGVDQVGAVQSFASESAPPGWIACDGRAVNRAQYARLFQRIGDRFGSGDGSTTFNVPDMRGEFVRGWDGGRGVDAGRVFGSAQADQFQGHRHAQATTMTAVNQDFSHAMPAGSAWGHINDAIREPITDGSNGPPRYGSETRPRNIALLYCIKF